MKSLLLLAGTAAPGLVIVSSTAPAEAAGCYYRMYHDGHGLVTGKLAIQGYASAAKLDNACDRASRMQSPLRARAQKGKYSS